MWHGSPAREDMRRMRVPHLTLLDRVRIFEPHGDVAELADAQVSEACDGDIVEVQVLSSPPKFLGEPQGSPFLITTQKNKGRAPTRIVVSTVHQSTRLCQKPDR